MTQIGDFGPTPKRKINDGLAAYNAKRTLEAKLRVASKNRGVHKELTQRRRAESRSPIWIAIAYAILGFIVGRWMK
jgi:hypothetical protein